MYDISRLHVDRGDWETLTACVGLPDYVYASRSNPLMSYVRDNLLNANCKFTSHAYLVVITPNGPYQTRKLKPLISAMPKESNQAKPFRLLHRYNEFPFLSNMGKSSHNFSLVPLVRAYLRGPIHS